MLSAHVGESCTAVPSPFTEPQPVVPQHLVGAVSVATATATFPAPTFWAACNADPGSPRLLAVHCFAAGQHPGDVSAAVTLAAMTLEAVRPAVQASTVVAMLGRRRMFLWTISTPQRPVRRMSSVTVTAATEVLFTGGYPGWREYLRPGTAHLVAGDTP